MEITVQDIERMIAQNQWQAAQLALQDVIAAHPNSGKAEYMMAQVQHHFRNDSAATQHFLRAQKLDPSFSYVTNKTMLYQLKSELGLVQTQTQTQIPTAVPLISEETHYVRNGVFILLAVIAGYCFYRLFRKTPKPISSTTPNWGDFSAHSYRPTIYPSGGSGGAAVHTPVSSGSVTTIDDSRDSHVGCRENIERVSEPRTYRYNTYRDIDYPHHTAPSTGSTFVTTAVGAATGVVAGQALASAFSGGGESKSSHNTPSHNSSYSGSSYSSGDLGVSTSSWDSDSSSSSSSYSSSDSSSSSWDSGSSSSDSGGSWD